MIITACSGREGKTMFRDLRHRSITLGRLVVTLELSYVFDALSVERRVD